MAELEYELREKDIRFFNDNQLFNTPLFKSQMSKHQATIPAAFCLIALFYFAYYQDLRTAIIVGVIGVAWGLLMPVYLRYNGWQQIRKQYKDADFKRMLGLRTLKAQPGRLIESREGADDSIIPWKDVMRIEVNKANNYGFVYFSQTSAIIIPKKTVRNGKFIDFMEQAMIHHENTDDE
jgi:hypothetical protein